MYVIRPTLTDRPFLSAALLFPSYDDEYPRESRHAYQDKQQPQSHIAVIAGPEVDGLAPFLCGEDPVYLAHALSVLVAHGDGHFQSHIQRDLAVLSERTEKYPVCKCFVMASLSS